ncbi:MAG TPA: TIGR03943 family protein [Leptolyngbyaceae cyanobacterium]
MNSTTKLKYKFQNTLLPWLDVITIIAWGILLLKYWVTGKLYLLIHPDYFWLVIVAGFVLLSIGSLKALSLVYTQQTLDRIPKNVGKGLIAYLLWLVITVGGLLLQIAGFKKGFSLMSRLLNFQDELISEKTYPSYSQNQHITVFPLGWSSTLLLITAILGFLITPRVFNSQTALERGVTDTLLMTRSQPQEFRSAKKPEERSLIDWVRTLNTYPEPDAYAGQKVKVKGFVVHPKELPDNYLLLSRFVLTCCAADAYPIGLPVKLNTSRSAYQPDKWLEIEGMMIAETFGDKRQLTIQANSLTPIPEPKNPYDY